MARVRCRSRTDRQRRSAFRVLPDGRGRNYSDVEAPSKRQAIIASLHRAKAIGFITAPEQDSYAILDVLDENDDNVQEYGIPNAQAWRWWYLHLHLRVGYTDGDPEPESHGGAS